jgi:hypothetical protein
MTDPVTADAERLATRGLGSALAAKQSAELHLATAEWHLQQVARIRLQLEEVNRQRTAQRDASTDEIVAAINAMVEVPVSNVLAATSSVHEALDALSARYQEDGGV